MTHVSTRAITLLTLILLSTIVGASISPNAYALARPTISSVSPNPAPALNSRQNFTINGRGFESGANVILRDLRTGESFRNRPVSSLRSDRIVITPNFTSTAAEWSVEVINPGGESSGQYRFRVGDRETPRPTISRVAPEPVSGSDRSQNFSVYGQHFDRGANVILRDLSNRETFERRTIVRYDDERLDLSVNFTNNSATWSVEIINPDGKSTGQHRFEVKAERIEAPAARPTISRVSSNPVIAADARQPFVIYGSNFTRNSNVILRDHRTNETFPNREIIRFSDNQIELVVNFTNASATWSVEVVNPDGQSTGQHRFEVRKQTIEAPAPRPTQRPIVSHVTPSQVSGSNGPQRFLIHGRNFEREANVVLRDLRTNDPFPRRQIVRFDDEQIELAVTFTSNAATWSVEVINPDGQSSGQHEFQVKAPEQQREPHVDMPTARSDDGGYVFITHGWSSDAEEWPIPLAEHIARLVSERTGERSKRHDAEWRTTFTVGNWTIEAFDWKKHAGIFTSARFGRLSAESARNAQTIGHRQATTWINKRDLQGKHVHLISHSAGVWMIDAMADDLHGHVASIHLTFLDAYVPLARGMNEDDLGDHGTFVEHYVDTTKGSPAGTLLSNAVNIDITKVGLTAALRSRGRLEAHSWPHRFYLRSRADDPWGVSLSRELGSNPSHADSRYRPGDTKTLDADD